MNRRVKEMRKAARKLEPITPKKEKPRAAQAKVPEKKIDKAAEGNRSARDRVVLTAEEAGRTPGGAPSPGVRVPNVPEAPRQRGAVPGPPAPPPAPERAAGGRERGRGAADQGQRFRFDQVVESWPHWDVVARFKQDKPVTIVDAARLFRPALSVNRILKAWKEYKK